MDKVVLGFAPTRRAIFSAPAAVVYRGLTAKRLKELNVDFVDIDDVNDEGLLYDDAGMEKIYEKFRDAKVDGFDLVEAYPFAHNENHAYHGPLSMYKKNGFEPGSQIEKCMVCRKML